MKKNYIVLGMMAAMILASSSMAHSQSLINKLKKKAEEKLIEKAFDENKDPEQKVTNTESETDDPANESFRNTRGSGLTTTPPDVKANIRDAEQTFEGKEFSQARHAIRQAIIGIEMEIGQNVLNDLPEQIEGLSKVDEMDKVTSNSMGFVGLTIERVYQGSDQELKINIGNEGLLAASASMYQGGAYESSTDQNQKQVDFKGHRSILEYDDYEGYTLRIPFGQSSVMVVNGVNFTDENEIMKAAGHIDIEKIKKQLGEK